ncbi:MAG: phosphoenolpyruvate--protein phosphotransferase [Anaerolineae bacterium]|nr:phosphoenolpyruvate--protein phosphotransferase [Anaerolineae bacterium]
MVGLVLVSHSAELAAAVKALAEQQTQGRAAIAAVGGTGDPDHPFGTDAMAILEAIQSVYSDDGVLVLMDLGSAILSAEMALEFMEPEQAARVRLCPAPFVEGAMAAAVQASIGMDLDAVSAEAMEAIGPKHESLGAAKAEEPAAPAPVGEEVAAPEAVVRRVTLINPAGLHFGPAVQFVQTAASYPAEIEVRNLTTGAGPANAKRFNQVLALGAEQGHEIEVRVTGPEAAAAADALVTLAAEGFGEVEEPRAPKVTETAPAATFGRGRLILSGIPASTGYAVGTVVVLEAVAQAVPRYAVADPEAEWARYQAAAERARRDLLALAERMAQELGPQQSRIFQAHAMLLTDEDLAGRLRSAMVDQRLNAEAALSDVFGAEAERLEHMEGQRFQERAADLRDLTQRLLRLLDGARGEAAAPALPDQAVVVAEDLTPSQTAALDRSRVVAFCTALGGPTSHTAILARSMAIPAVVGLGEAALTHLRNGARVAVDGAAGAVIVEPDAETQEAFAARRQAALDERRRALASAQAKARTADGYEVEVVANLATAAEAQDALQAGAEGVGLLRTEFLFQDRVEPPSEEEQYAVYRQVAEAMAGRPVVIRTLDIGGDKPAPYLQLPTEANPFLGWRAIRISLALPEFFKVQLRAILRAAVHGNVLVMFPMVATVEEVARAQALLAEAAAELRARGVPHADTISTGMMVEVPSAALIADQLAPLVDFFSIGTNDLTQYTFAVDRGNARVAGLADPLHPAVLRQIAQVIEAAHAVGKWVGLCGELAGRPEAIPILLGLGLDEFSMSAASIPAAKAVLARLRKADAQALARRVLDLPNGAAVRAEVQRFMGG